MVKLIFIAVDYFDSVVSSEGSARSQRKSELGGMELAHFDCEL
jgi:hypothetical protein